MAVAVEAADTTPIPATTLLPERDARRDKEGSRFGGTIGLLGGIGGGAPRALAGGTVTGGTAMATGWGCACACECVAVATDWSNEWPAAAAAAAAAAAKAAEYLPPGALWMVAVGCIFAGEGDVGGGTIELTAETAATAAGLTILVPLLFVRFTWLSLQDRLLTAAVKVPAFNCDIVGIVEFRTIPLMPLIPLLPTAVRTFWPGVRERAMPVVGPETGTLETVAVGCTILAIFTIGVTAHPSSKISQY